MLFSSEVGNGVLGSWSGCRGSAEGDESARRGRGPGERLFGAVGRGVADVAERVSRSLGDGDDPGHPPVDLSGLLTLTFRIWRANVAVLTTVGFGATALWLLAAAALEGVHSSHAFSGTPLIGVTVTVLSLLARGDRAAIEAVVGPAG